MEEALRGFCLRSRCFRLVKPESTEMSVRLLPERPSHVRLIANSNPVKSLMSASSANKVFNLVISPWVMIVPLALPSAASIATRRLSSGIVTGVESSVVGPWGSKNNTLTPWPWSAGMCSLMEGAFRGLFQSPRSIRLVRLCSTDTSVMLLWLRNRPLSLVKPCSADTSVMLLD